ncbi:glycosyltransferase [Paraliomyxa miuraensis]|uniref:glycosyltransferase n=1 Tax=Paraliomyxa miuraensis TaxID=376150 RepID=UPI00225B56BF|nr:glycosyltransferase [Paraliomyxa miuraensis]MCX4239295.1 glycosyltransferase [Paraliomyxa miuraensis]
MTSHELQRIDLHVHSKYAGRFNPAILRQLEVDESYTEPQDLYERLLHRGMSLVTITDHDAIQGCLEIAHLPYTFISEEVSARFPENGAIIHVLTYGITEAQHDELQRLRRNVYELVEYIRGQDILHVLAHPFSSVNHRLTPDQLRKSLLMFDTLEVINGQKDPHHEQFVRDVIAKVDDRMLERWAEQYDMPVPRRRNWGITAGSDDHVGWSMARAFTTFRGPRTFEGLRAAIDSRNVEVHGLEKNCESYAHTAYSGTIDHFRIKFGKGEGGAFKPDNKPTVSHLIELVSERKLPADLESLPPVLQRLIPAAFEALAELPELPSIADFKERARDPQAHRELYELVHGALLRAFRACGDKIRESGSKFDAEAVIDEIPTLLRLSALNLGYYFGFRFFNGERRRGWALYESLGLPEPVQRAERAAVFCDALDNVDGVSIGLRRIVHEMREDGREVYLCGAHSDDSVETRQADEMVRFPTLTRFPLPGYGAYELRWPSLIEVIRWLTTNEIDVVVSTTPGPVGLVSVLAAKMLDIPVIGQHHTNVGDFAARILGDPTIGRVVNGFTGWLYGNMREVAAPSRSTAGMLVEQLDVRSERVRVVRRGVDIQRFHPGHGDPSFWPKQGLGGRNTLLYVGRLSREKNLDFLVDVFRDLVDHGADIELALVGDGPERETLTQTLAGYPVALTGYLRGEQLATAYASASLFVFPSTNDTFGNVVMEALASGIPALVTDVGGPAELVHHREAGLVLPAGDHGRWKDAIETLMLDASRRRAMGRCARRLAEESTFERARAEQWAFYADNIARFRQDVRMRVR